MNKFFNKKHFKDDINEINKYIKETEDKLLEDSFHTLLNIEETNILLIKTNNTDKINKLEQDESYYFFQALIDDVLLSSQLIIKAIETIANDKYMKQYLHNKIIISN